MSFAATTTSTSNPVPAPANPSSNAPLAALMGALFLGAFVAQKSKRQLRRLKLKLAFEMLRLKITQGFRSLFSREPNISTTTLLYILLGLLVLILLFTLPPVIAIVVLLIGILLILLLRS